MTLTTNGDVKERLRRMVALDGDHYVLHADALAEIERLEAELTALKEGAIEGWAWHSGGSWRFTEHLATTSGDIVERRSTLILKPRQGER